ncbi:MAG: hypothetical protein M3033_07270 [Acidobacteriota bacterium]|nr:hypothetical protein [Acidobacteriota bacterium]
MIYGFLRLTLFALFICAASVCAYAQDNAPEKEDFPKGIKETLAKSRIEREKKDFQELLDHGEEAAKLGDELDKSFIKNNHLTLDDQRKLERLEKLSKKIREELGASGSVNDYETDEAEDAKLSTLSDAIDKLKNTTEKLSDELKKNSRYTISANAIQSSNAVLRIVRFIRQSKN